MNEVPDIPWWPGMNENLHRHTDRLSVLGTNLLPAYLHGVDGGEEFRTSGAGVTWAQTGHCECGIVWRTHRETGMSFSDGSEWRPKDIVRETIWMNKQSSFLQVCNFRRKRSSGLCFTHPLSGSLSLIFFNCIYYVWILIIWYLKFECDEIYFWYWGNPAIIAINLSQL